MSMMRNPFSMNSSDDYEVACSRCEVFVVISEDQRDLLLNVLTDDKRTNGARGKALSAALPSLGLQTGDRLEPSIFLRDTSTLRDMCVFPHPIGLLAARK